MTIPETWFDGAPSADEIFAPVVAPATVLGSWPRGDAPAIALSDAVDALAVAETDAVTWREMCQACLWILHDQEREILQFKARLSALARQA